MPSIMHGGLNYSGGGSLIEPNPAGTPTEQLNTVKINNTIYEIVGGGGSGSVYSRTTLYDVGVALPAQVTLSDDITNYDTIEIVISYESINKGKTSFYYDAKRFAQDFPYVASPDGIYTPHMVVSNYYPQYSRFIMGDANNKLWCYQSDHGYLFEVAGIKYENSGGSSSSSYIETELFSQTYGAFPSTINLIDDYTNYDALNFYFYKYDDNSYYDFFTEVYSTEFLKEVQNGIISGKPNDFIATGWQFGSHGQWVRYNFSDNQTLTKLGSDGSWGIGKITGIKYGSGGGGASTISALEDVSINNLLDKQVLRYNETSQKWENATAALSIVDITQTDYNLLTPAEKSDPTIIYHIIDGEGEQGSINRYGYTDPTMVANDGDIYYLLDANDKKLGVFLYKVDTWILIEGNSLT